MPTVAANIRRAAAESTPEFDWLLSTRPFFRVSAVAEMLDLGTTKVEELFEEWCHRYPVSERRLERARREAEQSGRMLSGRSRDTMRIPRAFVVAVLTESAVYSAEDKLRRFISCLREFDSAELLTIAREAQRLAMDVPPMPGAARAFSRPDQSGKR